jgi:hypothetical protein
MRKGEIIEEGGTLWRSRRMPDGVEERTEAAPLDTSAQPHGSSDEGGP